MAQLTDSVRQNLPKSRRIYVESDAATNQPLRIRLASGQTADAIEVENSSGTTLAKIASDGDLTAVDGTFTGNVAVTGTLTSKVSVTAKTTNYTVVAADSGKVFTTLGAAGAVTFTLPAAATAGSGWNAYFINAVAQDMVITGTAGELVTFNDAAANSVTFGTAGEEIGAAVWVVCDGTKHYVLPMIYEAVTATVAT